MSEPDYEAIGRCVVLSCRINSNINAIHSIKSTIHKSDSPSLLTGVPISINYRDTRMIEEAVIRHRQLLNEIAELAFEHNEYAAAAGVERIDVNISGQINKQTGN